MQYDLDQSFGYVRCSLDKFSVLFTALNEEFSQ